MREKVVAIVPETVTYTSLIELTFKTLLFYTQRFLYYLLSINCWATFTYEYFPREVYRLMFTVLPRTC